MLKLGLSINEDEAGYNDTEMLALEEEANEESKMEEVDWKRGLLWASTIYIRWFLLVLFCFWCLIIGSSCLCCEIKCLCNCAVNEGVHL